MRFQSVIAKAVGWGDRFFLSPSLLLSPADEQGWFTDSVCLQTTEAMRDRTVRADAIAAGPDAAAKTFPGQAAGGVRRDGK